MNEAGTIADTVRSALASSHPPLEVLVAVNGSTDDTAAVAARAGAHVLVCPEQGKARAQNYALAYAHGDVVVALDADTLLDSDAIRLMVEELEQGADATCAAVMPKPEQRGLYARSRRFEYALARRWWKRMHKAVGFVYVLSGCAAAYRRSALDQVGGFPHAIISEDTELTWRLYAERLRPTYTPAALCYSSEPETWRVYRAQARRWAAGSFQIIGKNKGLLRRPSAALVVGTTLWDLVFLPSTVLMWAYGGLVGQATMVAAGGWIAANSVLCLVLASREIGWREAGACFWRQKLLTFPNRGIYLWALTREWVLGRHFAAWTGRHDVGVHVSPMSCTRRAFFAWAGVLAALAVVVPG